ncbi:hypothetical protein [Pseudomonas sp. PDM07]|uniref:hypothetical protein n=1 Tax=Pseudomonas sp. PDM07 TaxID=2769264 RepID=UPI0017871755|nr:hypothetical protein [Pseudomonas sp. PDM07]MBD9618203.1 hypothetical protein [Pseudomonas sp. PDM07]
MASLDEAPSVDFSCTFAFLQPAHDRWLTSSGNERVVTKCLEMLLSEYEPRVILIAGEHSSGLSSVVYEIERRLSRSKGRALALYEDDDSDPRFILQSVVEALQMPSTIRKDANKKLPAVFESVLALRGYRYFLIHDAGRFLMFTPHITRGTRASLTYLLSLPMRAKLVIAATHNDVNKYSQLLEALNPECLRLAPMINDKRYAAFVQGLVHQNLSARSTFAPDVNAIHHKTRGLVGETAVEVFQQCQACA